MYVLRSHEGHHTRMLAKTMATLYFIEVSSGIYFLEKDRKDTYANRSRYLGSKTVGLAMQNYDKVAIERQDGNIVLNHKFIY